MTPLPPPFDELWFRLVIGLAVGLALGSFVTMLSYRLPRRLSIVKPGSFCPACKVPLKIPDLVPVVSWAASGGKCHHCGKKISARYPLIELAAALGSMAAFGLVGFRWMLILVLIGVVSIVTMATISIENKE